MPLNPTLLLATGTAVLAFSTAALAQDDPTATKQEHIESEEIAVEDALDTGGTETPGKQYMFVGARYRAVIIPEFIQHAFAEGGETLVAHTPGLEFVVRKDGFEYQLFAQLGLYSFEDVPFKGAGDPETAWEILDGDYKILTLGADFMWSTDDFSPGFSMIYGAGAGLGLVFGELVRTQAYPPGGTTDPYAFERCTGLRDPNGSYCDDDNDHYNGYVEPSWADGGSSPLIFPWIAANIGLRYKFARQFAMRVDAGLMLTGAFVGVGADFGL